MGPPDGTGFCQTTPALSRERPLRLGTPFRSVWLVAYNYFCENLVSTVNLRAIILNLAFLVPVSGRGFNFV